MDDIADRREAPRRRGRAVAVALVLLAVAGCGAREIVVPGPTSQPAAAPTSAPASATFRFPQIPPIVIPDVTALTTSAGSFADALSGLASPVSGIAVVGARCDPSGRIVTRAGLTQINNGDGSGSSSDAGRSVVNNGDGSGSLSDAGRTIVVNGDGSGSYSDAERTITINGDGSGTYTDAGRTVVVNGDGSGSYSDAAVTIVVNRDGSGSYSDAGRTLTVDPDGSGSYSDPGRTVLNHGDGTGTIDGVSTPMPPLDPMPLVGSFPPAEALTPVGTACGTLIRLDERVLFDFDQAVLRPEAGPVLDRIDEALAQVSGPLEVNGHTDAKGDDAYNRELSQRRAGAVLDGLRQRGRTGPVEATGFGETQPIAPNEVDGRDDPAGRQLNRRVEIVIPES